MKIAFTGPESTGKTSLSKAVAETLQAQWFPEYAREYLIQHGGDYTFQDIEKIGLKQAERRMATEKEGLKIYDTENIVLYIWSTFKYQKCASSIKELMEQQKFDHYFLCDPKDIPWEEDPLREHPHQREALFEIYQQQLEDLHFPYTILKGNFNERIAIATKLIQQLHK